MINSSGNVNMYETDFFWWTKEQAQALRKRDFEALDWINLGEEVEALGRSEYAKISSWVMRIIQHKLKIDYVAIPECIKHWKKEIATWQFDIERHISPSMKPKLEAELPKLFTSACKFVRLDYEEVILPESCPYSLEELLNEEV